MIPRTASLLPPEAYYDRDWFERELDVLLTPRWALVADAAGLATPGDYVTATVGRAPLVVIRGGDGQLAAFHNLCRHRGVVLLQGAGNISRTIDCPYHDWRYELDGTLAVVPQRREQFPELDPSVWGLLPASVAVWEGMVFAHPDPGAVPLGSALFGIPGHLGSHRPGLLQEVVRDRIAARCNWKLFVENHIDVYHLWYLHEDTLGGFDHRRFEYHQLGDNWASYEPLREADLASSPLVRSMAAIAHLDERDRLGIGAHMVFPNLLMATSAEFFATYVAEPVATDRTVIELRIRAEPQADPNRLLDALHSFIVEDVAACEAIQRGVQSPMFSVGPLARDLERPITTFHTNLLSRLGCGMTAC
jgi:Rieske 2Fe-2S family protein